MKNLITNAIFIALIVFISLKIKGIVAQCDDPRIQSAFCPIGIAENLFISPVPNKIPAATMVKQMGVTPSEMRFKVPFCRNCGFFFTYGLRIDAFSYPKLIRNPKLTSLSDEMMNQMSDSWNTFWNNGGTSYCNPSALGKPFGMWRNNNTFSSQYVSTHCESIQSIEFPTIEFMNTYPDIFKKTVSPDKVEYKTTLYIHSVYPFDLEDETDAYATSTASVPVTISYPLFARVVMTEDLFKAKEVLVTTTESFPLVLEVYMNIIPNSFSTLLDTSSCEVKDDGFNMKIESLKSDLGIYQMQLKAGKELENYNGKIDVTCKAFELVSQNGDTLRKDITDPVQFSLQVNHAKPRDISTTSRFSLDLKLFHGSENPFSEPFSEGSTNLIASGSDLISFGIKVDDTISSNFDMKIQHLRICAPYCSEGLKSKLELNIIKNGEILPEVAMASNQWFKIWNEDDLASFNCFYPGAKNYEYCHGWSIDVGHLMSFKYSQFMFEIEFRWVPKGISRTNEDEYYESAILLKQFSIFPNEEIEKSKWFEDATVIVSLSVGSSATLISLVGILSCLLFMFVALWFLFFKKKRADQNQ